jgi:uncharacterized protein (DUF2336 family)
MASGAKALISELDALLPLRSDEERVQHLREICDLFLTLAPACRADQISVFGEVMMVLVEIARRDALIELSGKLAPVDNAPSKVARRLARDDGHGDRWPMLTQSNALTDRTWRRSLLTRGRLISRRCSSEPKWAQLWSDVLLERDDPALIYRLASSEEVHFSEVGIVKLVYAQRTTRSWLRSCCVGRICRPRC